MNSRPSPGIPQLLKELEASDLSVAAFARKHGIAAYRLYWARKKARQSAADARGSDFAEVKVVASAKLNRPESTILELRLPKGCAVTLTRDFDEVTLRRLVDVVTQC